MRKVILTSLVAALILVGSTMAFAADCNSPLVQRWLSQHDQVVVDLMNAAVHERPKEEQAQIAARLIRLEVMLSSNAMCLDGDVYGDALKSHSLEVAPGEVLIRYITRNIGVDMDPGAHFSLMETAHSDTGE